MNELEVLDLLESAKGNKAKEKILSEHSHNPRLRELVDAAVNFKRKYFIKKFDGEPAGTPYAREHHKFFMDLLGMLERRELTGHAAINSVESFLKDCDSREKKWYARVIRKDLKLGIGISTFNKCGFDIPDFDVQLAKDAAKCKKLDQILSKTVFLSPKLDGYRCLAIMEGGVATLLSRNGTIYENFPSIEASLEELCPTGKYIFDGEIMSDNFNSMQQTAFASKRKTSVGDVNYHIFDMIPADEWETDNFKKNAGARYLDLDEFFRANMTKIQEQDNLKIVFHHKITAPSKQEVLDYEQACIAAGFEGAMLNPDIPYYRGKKSNKMLKFKTFHTWDCEILGFYEGEKGKEFEGTLGGVTVLQENGLECNVGSGFSIEERHHIWTNQHLYLGRIIEVKYQELNEYDKMRFGTKKRWRPDKDK